MDTTNEQPIRVRRRKDLGIESALVRGERRWQLKDPLTLQYWQFGEEELFLWQQLDGKIGLAEWRARFQRKFMPRWIDAKEMQAFLGMLHREGLVLADAPGQGEVLLRRDDERRWSRWLGKISNPLAIRFRGINPEPILGRLYPAISWIFSPWAVLACLLFIGSALLLVIVEWPQFTASWPTIHGLLTARNLAGLAVALALAKVLHELGHALLCKHFGRDCHELGVMLLVLTPCLYCNVSDAWLIPDKWRRMAVSAAGIYVELVVAAAATWLWWLTVPGPLNFLCLNLMVVCSVSTVLFNGNPLLRYDGYFILSDWLELPNLGAEAAARLRAVAGYCFGFNEADREWTANRAAHAWLVGYALASLIFRIVVVVAILSYLHAWFAAQRLEAVAYALTLLAVGGMVVPSVVRDGRRWLTPRHHRIAKLRLMAGSIVTIAFLAFILCMPWPRSIVAPATIRPNSSSAVYVTVAGQLLESTPPGTVVRRGEPIARLRNDELEFELKRVEGELSVLRKNLDNLRRQQVQDTRTGVDSAAGQAVLVEQLVRELAGQLKQKLTESEQLTLRAPADGSVISPPARSASASESQLDSWSRTPLDRENVGCFLEPGTLFSYVGDAHYREALVLLDQADVADVEIGQLVSVQLDELPGRILSGRVASLATMSAEDVPQEFAAKRWLAVEERDGRLHSQVPHYAMRVAIESFAPAVLGSSGQAKIHVQPRTLGHRLYDAFCRAFR